MERATEEITLSDGRKLTIQELNGLDEMIAAQVVGKEMNTGAGIVQYRAVLNAFSIASMDGEKIKRPTKLVEVQTFLSQFKMKDTSRIGKAFSRLNDDIEDESGEVKAAD